MKINMPKTGEKAKADYATGYEAGFIAGQAARVSPRPGAQGHDAFVEVHTLSQVAMNTVEYLTCKLNMWRISPRHDGYLEVSQAGKHQSVLLLTYERFERMHDNRTRDQISDELTRLFTCNESELLFLENGK